MTMSRTVPGVVEAVVRGSRGVLAMTMEQRGFAFGVGLVMITFWVVVIILAVRYFRRRKRQEATRKEQARKNQTESRPD